MRHDHGGNGFTRERENENHFIPDQEMWRGFIPDQEVWRGYPKDCPDFQAHGESFEELQLYPDLTRHWIFETGRRAAAERQKRQIEEEAKKVRELVADLPFQRIILKEIWERQQREVRSKRHRNDKTKS